MCLLQDSRINIKEGKREVENILLQQYQGQSYVYMCVHCTVIMNFMIMHHNLSCQDSSCHNAFNIIMANLDFSVKAIGAIGSNTSIFYNISTIWPGIYC